MSFLLACHKAAV